MLLDARRIEEPWRLLRSERALAHEQLAELDALFEQEHSWQEHRSFYEAQIAVVEPPTWSSELRRRVAELLQLPLVEPTGLTLQVMEPGQFAGVHSDRPLLGYEACRLVLQLDTPEGGAFLQHAAFEGPALRSFTARRGSAVAFELHPRAWHAVQPTRTRRRSAVFHFHHAGNTPALAEAVTALFESMAFGELPRGLDDAIAEVEARVDEEASFRACAVAWALHRWGVSEALLREGLQAASTQALPRSSTPVTLAAWAARLRFEHADLRAWPGLREWLADRPEEASAIEAFRRLAFPA